MMSATENLPTVKERLYGSLQGAFLGASVTYFTNYVFILIPYVGPFFESLPVAVGYVSGALNGSCNIQWLSTPPPVDLPKEAKMATALGTTALASLIVGFGCKNFFDEDPDPALAATIQTIAGGTVAYGLRAAVPFMLEIGKKYSWAAKKPVLETINEAGITALDTSNAETGLLLEAS